MTDMHDAIAARMEQQAADAAASRAAFVPDPELERLGARMDEMARTSPKEFADANLGALRTRLTTYRRRKAEHEGNAR